MNNAFQLHYTSCRYGLSGHAGFQTRAISTGIDPSEQRTLERLGIYQPPRNLPLEPTKEQIDELFPKAYRNVNLETGRLAIIRSAYVGQDYTGRGGNYFAHALVIENNLPVWPIDLYEWDGWKDKLLLTEDIEDSSFELEPIDLIPNKEAYSFPELQEFINESDKRKTQIAYMLQAVFMRKDSSRSLVIREEQEMNGLFWLACLQKSFPPNYQLDCSSFQFDPRSCLAINVTLGETDFILDENERKYQFYVFDFVDDNYSYIDSLNGYAKTISTWMVEQPDKLQQFYEFTKQFEYNSIDNILVSILCLFKLSDGISIESEDLVGILSATSHAKYFDEIAQIIVSSDELIHSKNPSVLLNLVKFLIEKVNPEKVYEKLPVLVINLFDQMLFTNDSVLINEIKQLYSQAKSKFISEQEFSTLFLAELHLSEINSHVQNLNPKQLSFVLKELKVAIQNLSTAEVYENEFFLQFVKAVILAKLPKLNQLKWLMGSFLENYLAIAHICIYISQILMNDANIGKESKQTFATFLSGMFEDKGNEYRFNVINEMKQHSITWEILEAEWLCTVNKQPDKKAAHEVYQHNVLQDDSEFSEKYQSSLFSKLLNYLPKQERVELSIAWIKNKQQVSDNWTNIVLKIASEGISFELENKKSNELCDMLKKQLKQHNITLSLNRLILREAIIKANVDTSFKSHEKYLNGIQPILANVDRETYEEFSQLYLPMVISRITEKEQHGSILKAVFCPKYADIFEQSYSLFYENGSPKQFDKSDNAALMFWLYADNKDLLIPKEVIVDWLASRIAKLKKDKYEIFLNGIKRKIDRKSEKMWQEIYSKVEKKRRSLLSSIFRWK